ncbi:MAG: hypothetical protein ABI611_00405 [Solirubrobacteraceae bacterium]
MVVSPGLKWSGGGVGRGQHRRAGLALLVPVMLSLLGKWAWWLPKPLDRVLPAVRLGHA